MSNLKPFEFDSVKTCLRPFLGMSTKSLSDVPVESLTEEMEFLLDRCDTSGYQIREDTRQGIMKTIACFATRRVYEIMKRADPFTSVQPPKGVMLCGGVGTGKTTLLKILRRCSGAVYLSVTDIVGSLLTDGWGFAECSCTKYQRYGMIIDDLGQESDLQHYGTKLSRFLELMIERRYQRFEKDGIMTVIATNLQPKDIEVAYGERTVSRLAAMVDIVPFNGTDWRKR